MSVAALLLAAGMLQAAPVSPDVLAFGLDKLTWGMSPQTARGQYPALDGAAMTPGEPLSTLRIADYDVAGCRFTVMLSFERGRLSEVELDSNGADHLAACNARLKRLLQDQYGGLGGGFSTGSHGFTDYGSWGGKQMDITYGALDGAFIEVTFKGAGKSAGR